MAVVEVLSRLGLPLWVMVVVAVVFGVVYALRKPLLGLDTIGHEWDRRRWARIEKALAAAHCRAAARVEAAQTDDERRCHMEDERLCWARLEAWRTVQPGIVREVREVLPRRRRDP